MLSSEAVDVTPSYDVASPNPFGYLRGTWKPRNLPLRKGKQAVRQAEKVAGIGKRRKRTPLCNEADTV